MIFEKDVKIPPYDLPWILVMGEPRSGKTTALEKSGLDVSVSKDTLPGSGGPVNWEWRFSNEAVIINTAGRFSMHGDSPPHRKEWDSFLGLLAQKRSRCPINGVVVAIPADSLQKDSLETIRDKARKIHKSLAELKAKPGAERPVYVMVSKSDLIFGFAEFFESLSASERLQTMGWSREGPGPSPFDEGEFSRRFDALSRRFYQRGLRRLRSSPPDRSGPIYAFPWEFKRIKIPLQTYLETIFENPPHPLPLAWRGCFFTSGLQEEKTIKEPARSSPPSRPYFIHDFYKKVFSQLGLLKKTEHVSRRKKGSRSAAWVVAGILFIFCGWFVGHAQNGLILKLESIQTDLKKAREILSSEKEKPGSKTIDALKTVRSLEKSRETLEKSFSSRFLMGFGAKSFLNDIQSAEEKILERGFVYPFLRDVGEDMGKIIPGDEKEMKRLLGFMKAHLSILTGKAPSKEPLTNFLDQWLKSGEWEGAERDALGKMLYRYADAKRESSHRQMDGEIKKSALAALGRFDDFWKKHSRNSSGKSRKAARDFMKEYEKILRGAGKITHLIHSADALRNEMNSGSFASSLELRQNCEDAYKELEENVARQYRDEMMGNRKDICAALDPGTVKSSGGPPGRGKPAAAPDGSIHPEFKKMMEALAFARDFNPSSSVEKCVRQLKGKINKRRDFIPVFDQWHENWSSQKNRRKNKIDLALEDDPSRKWDRNHKEQFQSALGRHLDQKLIRAGREIVAKLSKSILTDCFKAPRPSSCERRSWAESTFEGLSALHKRFEAPANWRKEKKKRFQNFLESWKKGVKSFDSGEDYHIQLH
ncbi:hypothetical protein EPICR_40229 [Candidatus Desulfarcum epimagneticum]|uniref:Type VI secretion system component TssM1 N-terminal domain-containing protein n=1 Tax=uncultured Desulfobacteraceae bacterium TaxID=218296 RepID=A0A484HJK7_9BACT|nr:hypothetical protein EPICR_40229 [uncultured Desulfobacteraceae bacterium]